MIPFAASASRYSDWIRALLESGTDIPLPPVAGKEQARVVIAPDLVLSVPVVGGASVLKKRDCRDVMISDHGRWREVHLGAWKSVFGKSPYFVHLYPEIEEVYAGYGEGSLEEFNRALHAVATRWLGVGDCDLMAHLRRMTKEKRLLVNRIGEDIKEEIRPNHSIFSALFRLGRETLFGII